MLQPAELKSTEKLAWSVGRGADVWALFQACADGDLRTVQAMIAKDRSLARAHYDYRKPLYFAVRENRVDVARFLLDYDSNPMDLWVDDDPIEIARDRGYAEMGAHAGGDARNEVQCVDEGRGSRVGAAGT